jgi:hypothetical protein
MTVQEFCEMAVILFSGKELQASPLYLCIPEANGTPERPLKSPRNIFEKGSELENLLRSPVRLRKAQMRTARTQTERSTGNRKAQ